MTAQSSEKETPLSEVARANIKAEMARRGWRQEDMARFMGMSRVAVTARGLGRTAWTLDEMQKAAHVLRVPLSELLLPRLDSNQQPFD